MPPPRQSRWLRPLLAVMAIVILVPIVAAIAFVATFDADAYKPRLVEAVKQATGRDLAIRGKIAVQLALVPTLRVEDLTLSNPPGFSRPEMVSLHRLDLRLALLPLLSRRIEVKELVLTGPDILLETNAAGQPNWQFQAQAFAGQPDPSNAPRAGLATAPSEIIVRRIEIDGGRLAYRDNHAATRVLALRKLTLLADTPGAATMLDATADFGGTPIGLKAVGLPLAAMLGRTAAPLPIDLAITVQGATASLLGSVTRLADLPAAELALVASIPDLAALSALAGTKLPNLFDVALQARIASVPAGFALRGMKFATPQANFDGDVTLTLTPRPVVHGQLHSAKIDGDALVKALSVPAVSTAPGAVAASPPLTVAAAPKSEKMFSDKELPLAALLSLDADVTLAVDQWLQGGVSYSQIAGHAVLKDGNLRLDPFAVTVPGGPVQLTLSVDAAQPQPPVSLLVHAPALSLQPVLAAFRLPAYAQGQAELTADLRAAGRSPHAIASSLDGSVALTAENARVDPALLGELLRQKELAKLAGGLTALRCLAVRAEAKEGVFDVRTLLIDTAPLRVTGTGTVNLATEALALRLLATARLGGAGLFAPVDVGGTLPAPTIAVGKMEGAPTSAKGSSQFALVIGRLGLDRMVAGTAANQGPNCEQALAIARGALPPAAPPADAAPAGKPPKPADLLRQLLR
jgi:uncharacterized protein involved in outer membrane biogenesis